MSIMLAGGAGPVKLILIYTFDDTCEFTSSSESVNPSSMSYNGNGTMEDGDIRRATTEDDCFLVKKNVVQMAPNI